MPRRDWTQAPDVTDLSALRDFLQWVAESLIALKARAPSLPAPTGLTVKPLPSSLRIEWDEVNGAARYNILVQPNPALTLFNPDSVPANPATTRNSFLAKNLPAAPKYVAVQAVDVNGKVGAISAFTGPLTPL